MAVLMPINDSPFGDPHHGVISMLQTQAAATSPGDKWIALA